MTTLPASGAGSLTANDTDDDGDTLTVIAAGPASHGTVVVLADGSVRYTPTANYNGPDSFVYTASDGLLTSSAAVTIDVRFGNIAPVANSDFYSVNEDSALVVAAVSGVLENDTDVEHDVLSAVLTSLPAHGSSRSTRSAASPTRRPRTTRARTPSRIRRSTARPTATRRRCRSTCWRSTTAGVRWPTPTPR